MVNERTAGDDSPPRIAIVVPSTIQPAWVARVLETLRAAPFADLAAVILHDSKPAKSSGILRRLYERIDETCFGRDDDAFATRDLSSLVDPDLLLESSDKRIPNLALDVIVAFATTLPRELLALPRHGVWTCHFDSWAAFAAGQPTTTCAIEVERAGDRRIVATTRARTDPISLRRGMSRLAWRAAALLPQQLELLHRNRPASLQQSIDRGETVHRASKRPSLHAIADARMQYALQRFRDRYMVEQWQIAFRFRSDEDDPNDDLASFHRIVPPPDRLWADPFVVDNRSSAFIFVEELVYREARGVIAVIEAFPDGTWSAPRRVLEREYHLSYPCVFRWNESWYMVPETMANGTIELFRAVDFPWRWEFAKVLLGGRRAVDNTVFEAAGRWWMFTTTTADGNTFDELSIYYAESPEGPWLPHRKNPVLSDIIGGRCAGRPFGRGGRLLRPAQNSARRYGHSIQLREIVALTPEEWEERDVATIEPWARGLVGTHTFNVDGNVTAIDGVRHRWRR